MTIGLKRGAVTLAPHNADWHLEYKKERDNLRRVFGDRLLTIEHIGSTAIPGIMTKPIIDILVAVESIKDIAPLRELLEGFGYEYRENGSSDEQIFFAKGSHSERTHYLHVTTHGSSLWEKDMAFRDYLRSHLSAAKEYDTLKQGLAQKFPNDRGAYTKGKRRFIDKVAVSEVSSDR